MGIFSSLKDNLSSAAAEKFIADYLSKYGKLTSFKINSSSKSIKIGALLHGESSSIDIDILKYNITSSGNKDFFEIIAAKVSKEWMNQVLNDYFLGKKLEIPAKYSNMVKKIL